MIQETSIEAQTLAPNRAVAVEQYISSQGERGATDWEIHAYLAAPYSAIQSPRGALVQAGVVRDSGLRRRTGYGRRAIVWVAA
jgi:hypothetical protein